MSQGSDSFDPYYFWLGIPPEDRPASHYRLLDVRDFEPDRDLLDLGHNRRVSFLDTIKSPEHRPAVERIRAELDDALKCLLDARQRSTYDARLRQERDELRRQQQVREEVRLQTLRKEVESELEAELSAEYDKALHDALAERRRAWDAEEQAGQKDLRQQVQAEVDAELVPLREKLDSERAELSALQVEVGKLRASGDAHA